MSHGLINPTPKQVNLADGAQKDAFERLRVSDPTSLFSSLFNNDLEPLQFEQIISQSGAGTAPAITHSSTTRMAQLSIAANVGEAKVAALQSHRFVIYQPGKSQRVLMTGVIGAAVAGATKRLGYFNATHAAGVLTLRNGIYFEQDSSGVLNWVICNNGSATAVPKSSWSVDKLDGSGPSGLTLDITKSQIFGIDFQFLGMGRVRVGFDIGGMFIVCHEFLNANTTLTGPYMQTGTLPVRAEISGTNVTASMHLKCCDVTSEGGVDGASAPQFSVANIVNAGTNARRFIIAAIRPRTTFNSITNRTCLIPISYDAGIINDAGNPASGYGTFELLLAGTPDAALTYADVNTAYSATEWFQGDSTRYLSSIASAVVIDKAIIPFGGGAGSGGVRGGVFPSHLISQKMPITLDANGAVRDLGTLYLVGQTSADAGSIRLSGALNWVEVR